MTASAASKDLPRANLADPLVVLAAYARQRPLEGRERELIAQAIAHLALQLLEIQTRAAPCAEVSEPDEVVNDEPRGYPDLVADVRSLVDHVVPTGQTVAVVSKGDPDLVRLPERRTMHFPAGRDGRYAGFYPADGEAALAQLDAAVEAGARYLVFPETSRWWLDYYRELASYLHLGCRIVADEPGVAVIFELPTASPSRLGTPRGQPIDWKADA